MRTAAVVTILHGGKVGLYPILCAWRLFMLSLGLMHCMGVAAGWLAMDPLCSCPMSWDMARYSLRRACGGDGRLAYTCSGVADLLRLKRGSSCRHRSGLAELTKFSLLVFYPLWTATWLLYKLRNMDCVA